MSIVIYGPVVNPVSPTSLDALPRCLLAVNEAGTIDWIEPDVIPSQIQETLAKHGYDGTPDLIELKHGQFLMPGFIDTHTHAPQFPNIGGGGKYELLEWLDKLTFPEESKYKDVNYARSIYTRVIRKVLACGTTTCCYYGTAHLEGTKALADLVYQAGQRALVGKCNMDRNCPDHYVETTDSSIADTKAFVEYCQATYLTASSEPNAQPLVQPILTPRFAITCSGPLLETLGQVAKDASVRVQTHISENKAEVAFTKELFPDCTSYAGVYDRFGLLKGDTILAHAIHLEEEEIQLIKERNSGISHCPTSNFNLNSGISPVGYLLDRGLKVGLGTDVSGGFSHSIITAIQHASIASKVLAFQASDDQKQDGKFALKPLTLPTLLHLSTLGGAQVCNMDKLIGSFAQGKAFDALLVDVTISPGGSWRDSVDMTSEKVEQILEEFFFTGDDRSIRRVYVQGRLVAGVDFTTH
ncbi:Metallo-dependent hydrolase [Flagelloscypha sp. PMI_526]|nr:Metallo-dependent hydrolase [Flagelloscypha sp. PMI_526]